MSVSPEIVRAIESASERLDADLRFTTGRRMRLEVTSWPGDDLEVVGLWIDDVEFGAFGLPASTSAEGLVADLADAAREHSLDREIWGGWPFCPNDGTYLRPEVEGDVAVWRCRQEDRGIAPIGGMASATQP